MRAQANAQHLDALATDLVQVGGGLTPVDGRELAPAQCLELWFDSHWPAAAVKQVLTQRWAQEPLLDWAIQPARDNRVCRLLICDMDSTLIQAECIDELAAEVGLKEPVAAITERAMNGELDFESALRERVALLKGLPESVIQQVWKRLLLMPGAETLTQVMRKQGAKTVIVSGGFTPFTQRLCDRLEMDAHHANTLGVANGVLTGEVVPPILGREAKRDTLKRYQQALNISTDVILAAGDGANDLAMVQAAGLGVAFRAKPVVAQAAPFAITHNDLRALLWLQGLPTNAQ